jgi:hypothetical protein
MDTEVNYRYLDWALIRAHVLMSGLSRQSDRITEDTLKYTSNLVICPAAHTLTRATSSCRCFASKYSNRLTRVIQHKVPRITASDICSLVVHQFDVVKLINECEQVALRCSRRTVRYRIRENLSCQKAEVMSPHHACPFLERPVLLARLV